jgi:hypothetical protein
MHNLPESYGVSRDRHHPRWDEVIKWINSTYGTSFSGLMWNYYGRDSRGILDCHDTRESFEVILTVDEFFELVEESREITNYSIY